MNNYAMTRGWMDHDIFDPKEPFTKREAWLWLIENACWKETRARVAGKYIQLKRGQLSFAIRFIAEKWLWNRSGVERFLNRLKNEAMIETSKENFQQVITICNYDKYQLTPNYHEEENETVTETRLRQERDKIETKKNTLNTLNTINTSTPHAFERFWEAFPRQRRGSRAKAMSAYRKAIQKTTEEIVHAATIRYSQSGDVKRGFAKGAEAWLNDERWTDEPVNNPPPTANGKPAYGDSLANAAATVLDHLGREEDLRTKDIH